MEGIPTTELRNLTAEETQKLLKQDESLASDFKRNKLEIEAKKKLGLIL